MPGRNPPPRGEGAGRTWSLKEIRELMDVLIERGITEFEMEKGGVRIRIKRGNAGAEAADAMNPRSNTVAPWPSLAPPSPPIPASPPAGSVESVVEPAAAEV